VIQRRGWSRHDGIERRGEIQRRGTTRRKSILEVKAVHGTAHSAARRREASVFSARGHDYAYSFS
jgi:hypothetical protein